MENKNSNYRYKPSVYLKQTIADLLYQRKRLNKDEQEKIDQAIRLIREVVENEK